MGMYRASQYFPGIIFSGTIDRNTSYWHLCLNLELITYLCCLYASVNWVIIGSGNGLLSDGTKPLPEPTLTNCELDPQEQTPLNLYQIKREGLKMADWVGTVLWLRTFSPILDHSIEDLRTKIGWDDVWYPWYTIEELRSGNIQDKWLYQRIFILYFQ